MRLQYEINDVRNMATIPVTDRTIDIKTHSEKSKLSSLTELKVQEQA